jgi:outer membrane protein OmpA-like peptidoglycan-associated protein
MISRFRSRLSGILFVGCALAIGASSMYGQSPSPAPAAPGEAPISKIDWFMGYSYLSPHDNVNTLLTDGTTFTNTPNAVDYGAITSVAYYFNKHVGGQVELGFHPQQNNFGAYTFQGGIIFRFPVAGMVPFVHGLAGAARTLGPNSPPFTGNLGYAIGPALTAGGGLDYDLPFFNNRFGLRLFQADYEYFHVNYGPQALTGGRLNSNTVRLSTGLVVHFGNIVPPPPVQYACSTNPSAVFPGEPVTVTGTASNLDPKRTATYSWSGQGVTISSTSSTATIDTASLQPGTFSITGHVTMGTRPGQSADCTTQFTVKPFEPPTISCVANPSSVNPGDSSTITAQGVSPQNRPLTYSFTASAGTISGSGSTATLSTTGAPAGTITVTGTVTDDKGQTASCTAAVTVAAPPPAPPATQKLCSITFDHDKKRPARVDNDAKGCLDDVALNAQRLSDASLVVVGNSTTDAALAAQRAVNTKAYLVTEKGIDASRISVKTTSTGPEGVDNYLVPAGANFDHDVPGTTAVDETAVTPQARKALPQRRARARHKAPAAEEAAPAAAATPQ